MATLPNAPSALDVLALHPGDDGALRRVVYITEVCEARGNTLTPELAALRRRDLGLLRWQLKVKQKVICEAMKRSRARVWKLTPPRPMEGCTP